MRLNAFEVDFTAGDGDEADDVPGPIRHALKLLVAHWFERREVVVLGLGAQEVPATVEADRLAGSVSHEVALRYRPGIVPAMRFRKGARVFHIVSVIDVDERRRWLKCLCEERDL